MSAPPRAGLLVLLAMLVVPGLSSCNCRGPQPSDNAEPAAGVSAAAASESISREGHLTRGEDRVEVISPVYEINRIYKSMTGPWSNSEVRLLDTATPELVWITGLHVEMVGPDGAAHMPEQFMCHANVDFDADFHNDLFRSTKPLDGRLFTLSQGQLHVDFPKGFGIPVMSNEVLDLSTQVLNLNVRDRSFDVRHKVHFTFVRDRDQTKSMKPLYERAVMGMVSLEGRELVFDLQDNPAHHAGHDAHTDSHHANERAGHAAHGGHAAHAALDPALQPVCTSCCVPGTMATNGVASTDSLGRQFTTHWIVRPGREVNHTRVTTMMALPFDTTIHYIAVHMHPFAESLELRDVTADRSLFKSNVQNLTGEIGLAHVDHFSSEEGIPVYKNHEYELVSIYNNTTPDDQDSMAVMYVYFLDQDYKGPDSTLADVQPDRAATEAAAMDE